jgi:thiol-disulfide isomerase/thioredoxin
MIKSIRFIFLALIVSSAAFGQTINQIKLKDLEKILTTKTERIQVINFWATWCAPCVKEIPLFEKLKTDNSSVDITLVSMDFDLDPDPAKVERFVTRKALKNKVVILAETDPNSWIDKIDKNWGGALPATLVVNTQTGKRKLVQKELHEGDLEKLITEVSK